MARDTNFWTWQLDPATERNNPRRLCALVLGSYLAGALILVAQPQLHLPPRWNETGMGLVLAAILGSFVICVRVVLGRSRLAYR